MKCPYCGYEKTHVSYKLPIEENVLKRLRKCDFCKKKFYTIERPTTEFMVIKKGGAREPFDIEKLENSLKLVCMKRPISLSVIKTIAREVKYTLATGVNSNEIPTSKIAEEVLKRLIIIDKVSYLRYLSLYKKFSTVKEFIKAIQEVS